MRKPATEILTLCDALVERVNSAWSPKTPDQVERFYVGPKNDELKDLRGRRVYFAPNTYTDEPASRGESLNSYEVVGFVVERCRETGRAYPSVEWIDERVDFVKQLIDWLDFARDTENGLLTVGNRRIWTQTLEPVDVYDQDALEDFGTFIATLRWGFREIN